MTHSQSSWSGFPCRWLEKEVSDMKIGKHSKIISANVAKKMFPVGTKIVTGEEKHEGIVIGVRNEYQRYIRLESGESVKDIHYLEEAEGV